MAQKETPAGRRTSSLARFYVVLAVIAVLGIGAVGYNVAMGGRGGISRAPLDLEGLDDPESLVAMARGVTKGDPDAAVTLVEFADYQCPACGQFARDFEPGVELALIQTGRAKLIFHDYPLVSMHPHAFFAARAARCAEDQGEYWEYHDELYRQQVRWSPEPDPTETFESYAEALGLDAAAFRSCLRSDRHADLVTANMKLAEALGVSRTPTILVNVPGAGTREVLDWDATEIAAMIDEMSATAAN